MDVVQGALWGAVASMAAMAFIVGGSQYYTLMGQLQFPSKIVSIDHCPLDTILYKLVLNRVGL